MAYPQNLDEYFQLEDAERILLLEIERNAEDHPKYYLSDGPYATEPFDEPADVVFSPIIGDGGLPALSRSIADPFDGVGSTSFGSVSFTEDLMAWFFDNGIFDMAGDEDDGTALILDESALSVARTGAIGAYTNSSGMLVQQAANTARFTRDPISLAHLGLLIEGASTNLALSSADASSWPAVGATVTSNAVLAPDGTVSMDIMRETAASTQHVRSQSLAVVSGQKTVASIYAKALTTEVLMESEATLYVDFVQGIYKYRAAISDAWIDSTFAGLFGDFTRSGSNARYITSTGLVSAGVPANTPRFTYDPTTGDSLGLMTEPAATNFMGFSEDFSQWGASGGTITSNTQQSPDGNVTADTLTENTAVSAVHGTNRTSNTFAAGSTLAASVWVKAGSGSRQIQLDVRSNGGTVGFFAVYTLTGSGAVGTPSVVGTGTVLSGRATIKAYPNGWYRCSVTGTVDVAATTAVFACYMVSGGTSVYTGDGTSSLHFWGVQLERVSTTGGIASASSYIQTTTSASAARSHELCRSLTFPAWLNASQGTLYVRMKNPPVRTFPGSTSNIISVGPSGVVGDLAIIQRGADSDTTSFTINTTSVTQYNANRLSTALNDGFTRAAIAYATNDMYGTANGVVGVTDTLGTVPPIDCICVGGSVSGSGNNAGGEIQAVMFYPTRLSNANVELLTTEGVKRYLSLDYNGPNFGGVTQAATFDLDLGLVTQSSGGALGRIEPGPNDTYRCSLSTVAATASANSTLTIGISDTGVDWEPTYNGDGISGFAVWGLQHENHGVSAVAGPTSYIPTAGVSASRALETGTATIDPITEGYLYVKAIAPYHVNDTTTCIRLDDTTANERVSIFRDNATGTIRATVFDGGVQQALLIGPVVAPGSVFTAKLSWALNSFSLQVNGSAPAVDAAGTVPNLTTLRLRDYNAPIQRIMIGDAESVRYDWDFLSSDDLVSQRILDLGHGSGIERYRAKRGARVVGKVAAPRRLYPYSEARTLFTGRVSRKSGDSTGKLTLEITDLSETIKKAIVPVGDDPQCYGRVDNVKCRLRDPLNLGYSFHDGPVSAVRAVYDQGVKLDTSQYVVNLAGSPQITLGAEADGEVTADVDGGLDQDGNWIYTTAQLITELMRRSDIPDIETDFSGLDEGVIGIYIEDVVNLGSQMTDLCRGCAGYWLIDEDGLLVGDSFPVPADGGATIYTEQYHLKEANFTEDDRLFKSVRYSYRKNYTRLQPKIGASSTQEVIDFMQADALYGEFTLAQAALVEDDEAIYADSPMLETYFYNEGSAQFAARRIVQVFGVARKLIDTELPYSETRRLGDPITLYFNGEGYQSVILSLSDVFDGTYPVQKIGAIA
jgi:hypothetical protein